MKQQPLNPEARTVVVPFRVRPATAKLIQRAARADARSVSGFLSFLIETALGAGR